MVKSSSGGKANAPNERLFHNLAIVKAPKDSEHKVTKPVWQILVDERTGMKFTGFYDKKSSIVEPTCQRLAYLETMAGRPVQYLRQDNAGENKKLAARLKSSDWKRETVMEYTANATPQ